MILKDIKFQEIEALLDYMYIGEVEIKQSELAGLIKAAECLRIKGLAVADEDPTGSSPGSIPYLVAKNAGVIIPTTEAASPPTKRSRKDNSLSNINSADVTYYYYSGTKTTRNSPGVSVKSLINSNQSSTNSVDTLTIPFYDNTRNSQVDDLHSTPEGSNNFDANKSSSTKTESNEKKKSSVNTLLTGASRMEDPHGSNNICISNVANDKSLMANFNDYSSNQSPLNKMSSEVTSYSATDLDGGSTITTVSASNT